MTRATKRPAAQVAWAQKAAELKTSNAVSSHDPWSRFCDAPTPPLTITVKQAARLTGLSKTTIWKYISSGLLRSTSVGRSRLIHFSSLESLVFGRTSEPKQSCDIATHFSKMMGRSHDERLVSEACKKWSQPIRRPRKKMASKIGNAAATEARGVPEFDLLAGGVDRENNSTSNRRKQHRR